MKEKDKLIGKELTVYKSILMSQDMESMFEFGVVIGRAQIAKEALEKFHKHGL